MLLRNIPIITELEVILIHREDRQATLQHIRCLLTADQCTTLQCTLLDLQAKVKVGYEVQPRRISKLSNTLLILGACMDCCPAMDRKLTMQQAKVIRQNMQMMCS